MPASPFTTSDDPSDESSASTSDLIIKLQTSVTSQVSSETSVNGETDAGIFEHTAPVDCELPEPRPDDKAKVTDSPTKSLPADKRVMVTLSSLSSTATSSTSVTVSDVNVPPNPRQIKTITSRESDLTQRPTEEKEKDASNYCKGSKSQIETAVHPHSNSSPPPPPPPASAVSLSSTPPDSTVTHCSARSSSSSAAAATATALTENKKKQIEQLQRFLSALQSFANDLSPEISHATCSLVIALSTSSITVDEFIQRVQEVTQYPLRSYVLPFLQIHVPVYQSELRQVASKYSVSIYSLLSKSHTNPFDFINLFDKIKSDSTSRQLVSSKEKVSSVSIKQSVASNVEAFEIFLPPLPLPSGNKIDRGEVTFQPSYDSTHVIVPSSHSSLLTIPASVFNSNSTRPASDVTRLNNNFYPSILSHLSIHPANNNRENYFKSPKLPTSNLSSNLIPLNMGIKDLPVKRRLSSPPDSRKENELHPPSSAKRPVTSSTAHTLRNHPVIGHSQSIPSTSVNCNQSSHPHASSPYHSIASNLHSMSKLTPPHATTGCMVKQTTTTNTTSMNCNDHHHPRQGQFFNAKSAPTPDRLAQSACNNVIRKDAPETDEEWQNIHTMLNCIRGMVDKTMKAIAILQMRSMEQTNALSLVVTSNSRSGTSAVPANSTATNSTSVSGLPSNGKMADTTDQGCNEKAALPLSSSSLVSSPSPSCVGTSMTASSASQHMMTCAVSSLATAGQSSFSFSSPSLVQHPHHQRSNHVTAPAATSTLSSTCTSSSTSSPSSLSASSSHSSLSPSPPSANVTSNHGAQISNPVLHYSTTLHPGLSNGSSAVQLMKLASGVKQSNVNSSSSSSSSSSNCISSQVNPTHHNANGSPENGLLSISTSHQHLLDSCILKDRALGHLRALAPSAFLDAAFEAKRLTVHKTPTADSNSSLASGVGGSGLGGGSTTVNASDLIERAKLELMLSQAMMRRQAVAAAAFVAREDSLAPSNTATTSTAVASAAPTSPPAALSAMTVNSENCWNCGREANERCSGCNVAKYCSYFCQHKDWESHHKICGTSLYSETNSRASVMKASDLSSHRHSPSNIAPCKSFHRASSPLSVKSPLHPFDRSNKALRSHSPDLPVIKSTSPLTSAKTHSPSPLQLNND